MEILQQIFKNDCEPDIPNVIPKIGVVYKTKYENEAEVITFIPFKDITLITLSKGQITLPEDESSYHLNIKTSSREHSFHFTFQPNFIVPEEDRKNFESLSVYDEFIAPNDRAEYQYKARQNKIEEAYKEDIEKLNKSNLDLKEKVQNLYTTIIMGLGEYNGH